MEKKKKKKIHNTILYLIYPFTDFLKRQGVLKHP